MANTITLYYETAGGTTQIAQISASSVSLDNSGTNVLYSSNSVNLIEAELDATSMTATITPLGTASAFEVRALTPSFSTSPITTGGVTWQPSGSGTQLTFLTPGSSGQEIAWPLNDAAPPIRLTVKIKRN